MLSRKVQHRASIPADPKPYLHLTTRTVEVLVHLIEEVSPLHVSLSIEGLLDIVVDHLNTEFPHFKQSANDFPTRRYVVLTSMADLFVGVGPPWLGTRSRQQGSTIHTHTLISTAHSHIPVPRSVLIHRAISDATMRFACSPISSTGGGMLRD